MFNNYSLWDSYWRSYRINSEAAIQIALQLVPGQVIKVELDYENGILVYEIDIRTQSGIYEVHVNATTGQILRLKRKIIGFKLHNYAVIYPLDGQGESLALLFGYNTAIATNEKLFKKDDLQHSSNFI